MTPRSVMRLIRDVCILLVGLWVVFIAAQVVGAAVPDRAIAQQLEQSIDDGLYERSYPPNGVGGQHDAYTDCVVAGTGLGDASMSVWERAVLVPRISSCTNGGVDNIRAIAAGEEVGHQLYLRYWAGYTVLFRPALALGGMAAMNAVALAALAAGLLSMWTAVSRRATPLVAAALSLPLLISSDVLATPGGSSEHALSLGIAFGGVAAAVWASSRGLRTLFLVVVAAGAVFNFFDLLNNPNLAWTLTAAAGAFCAVARGERAVRVVWAAIIGSVGWIVGFASAFAERWITAIIAAGPDEAVPQIVGNIAVRSGMADTSTKPIEEGVGQSFWINVMYFGEMPLALIVSVLALLVTVGCLGWAVRRRGAGVLLVFLAAAAPAMVVPFWYEVMSNHSQIHTFFMYRAVPAAIGVVLAAAVAVCVASSRRALTEPVETQETDRPVERT